LRRYKPKSIEVGVFRRGWVTLSANFRRKGASLTDHCCCQKMWHTDRPRQTDGRTQLRLPRPC